MVHLLSLPHYVLLTICNEFLTVEEFCSLDTANCSHKLRKLFLSHLQKTRISFQGVCDSVVNGSILRWLCCRNINVVCLNLRLNDVEAKYVTSYQCDGLQRLTLADPVLDSRQMLTKACHTLFLKHISSNSRNLQYITLNNVDHVLVTSITTNCCQCLLNASFKSCLTLTAADFLSILKTCTMLQSLDISKCSQVRFYQRSEVAVNCTKLQHLNVEGITVTDHTICHSIFTQIFKQTPTLTSLFCYSAGGVFNSLFSHCSQLIHFECISMQLPYYEDLFVHCHGLLTFISQSYNVFDVVHMIPNTLTTLTIKKSTQGSHGKYRTDAMMDLAVKCRALTTLSIPYAKIDRPAFVAIGDHCHKIITLNIAHCPLITDIDLTLMYHNFTLQKLNVSHCSLLTAHGFANIAQCPHLIELCADECEGFVDSSLEAVISHCEMLQVLSIKGCPRLTGAILLSISIQCSALTHLFVSSPVVNNKSLSHLHCGCAQLKLLDISSKIVAVNNTSIRLFQNSRPNVKLICSIK